MPPTLRQGQEAKMDTKTVLVPIHDISHKMDDILKQLADVQRISVDPTAARSIRSVTSRRR